MKGEAPARPRRIGVVITTYNSPRWLEKVLWGYEHQDDTDFTAIVADDGSGPETAALIDHFRARGRLRLEHEWQEDEGFRKCRILNQAIASTDCDYLIFTDGDCVPEPGLIRTHRTLATPGQFLSGGYIKLSLPLSEALGEADIASGACFDRDWLVAHGQPRSHKLWKLLREPWKKRWLNRLTPAAASWNGMNSSTWTADLRAVNGFNEDMQYGGLDRELGERLWHYGHRSRQIRYSTVCLHLDHPRGYARPEIWARNRAIRDAVKREKRWWTPNGILKQASPDG